MMLLLRKHFPLSVNFMISSIAIPVHVNLSVVDTLTYLGVTFTCVMRDHELG